MRNKGLDLRHHSFGRAMRGLDETEVLSFLQATAPDYEQAHAEVASLRQQLDETAVELRRLQEQERAVTRLLVAAEEDARMRLEGTAKQVAEIERKAEERVRALLGNAETQRARMQDEVRAIVSRRSIAANGLTELIDALSRRAASTQLKPAPAAPPLAPARIVQPAPAAAPTAVQAVPAPVTVPQTPSAQSATTVQPAMDPTQIQPLVIPAPTTLVEPRQVVSIATPPAVAIAPPPVAPPALPAEPASLLGLSALGAGSSDASTEDAAPVVDGSLSTDGADATDAVAEDDAPGSRRSFWVAAAGVVLAVTTAAALGYPRMERVTDEAPPATAQAKPVAAPAPAPKPVTSETAESRPQVPAVPSPVAAPAAPLAVTLKANRQCWLRLVVDGRTETKTLAEGEELSRTATREIELRVGDAAAIGVTVNGRALAPLGRNGQVVDTVFHADLSGTH